MQRLAGIVVVKEEVVDSQKPVVGDPLLDTDSLRPPPVSLEGIVEFPGLLQS
jgi:hypothetical protein